MKHGILVPYGKRSREVKQVICSHNGMAKEAKYALVGDHEGVARLAFGKLPDTLGFTRITFDTLTQVELTKGIWNREKARIEC